MTHEIHIIPITSIGNISGGDSLANSICRSLKREHISLKSHDIIVVTQKVVSKAEGRIVSIDMVAPSAFAITIAKLYNKDPRHIEVILQQTKRIVRMDKGILICETHHGFVCANAGVDASNMDEQQTLSLLPLAPDESAKEILHTLLQSTQAKITHLAVIISDTWGRPWREGQVNVAIGSYGIDALIDYRGMRDTLGRILQATIIAVADELASAAELVMNKCDSIPVAIIRGYRYKTSGIKAQALLRKPETDLFR